MNPFTGKMEILFCGKIYFKTKNLGFRFFPQQGNSSGKKNLLVPSGGRFIVLRAKTRRRKENSFAAWRLCAIISFFS